jgi:transcriptional regulator with XRE-family HTH domain
MARGPQGLKPQRGLGRAVRSLREEIGMSQTTLAEKTGVSASWISRIEQGDVDPTWATMRQLASGLGVSLESLAEAAERFEESSGH